LIYQPQAPLIFIHVPKSAGKSVQLLFREWFGKRLHLHYYHEPTGTPPEVLDAATLADRERPPVIFGHFNRRRGFGVEHSYPSVRQFATMLRDPFETAVSAYFFTRTVVHRWKDRPEIPDDIGAWLEATPPNILNHFPRPVTRENYKAMIEECFIHVGVVENLPASLQTLADTLGKPFDPATIPRMHVVPRDQPAPPELRDRYRERYPLEFEVYEHVRAMSIDNTEWLGVENGVHLTIGTEGNAEIENPATGAEAIALTFAADPEHPEFFLFKRELDGKIRDFMSLRVPGYTPPAEGEAMEIPEKIEKLEGYANGSSIELVPDNDENRKAYDKRVAFALEQAKKVSIEDAPREASGYVDVVKEFGPNWATYYVLSQEGSPVSDEDKLGMLSRKWNSTSDSFEREAMKGAELGKINAAISAMGKTSYIALPVSIATNNPWLGLDRSEGYDFERKGFPLTGALCSDNMAFSNENDVRYSVSDEHGADVCFVQVPDPAIAKQVERLRIDDATGSTRGTAFYKIGPTRGNRVTLLAVGTKLEFGEFDYAGNGAPIYTTTTWGTEREQQD